VKTSHSHAWSLTKSYSSDYSSIFALVKARLFTSAKGPSTIQHMCEYCMVYDCTIQRAAIS